MVFVHFIKLFLDVLGKLCIYMRLRDEVILYQLSTVARTTRGTILKIHTKQYKALAFQKKASAVNLTSFASDVVDSEGSLGD